jgi:integrase
MVAKKAAVLRGDAGIKGMGREARLFDLTARYLEATSEKYSHKRDIISSECLVSFFGNRKLSEMQQNDLLMMRYIKARMEGSIEIRYRYRGRNFVQAMPTKRRNPAKRTTVNREFALLRSIFNHAIEWGECEKNPIRKGMIDHRAEEHAKRLEFLEVSEIRPYLDACATQYYPVALTALETGLRKQEILSLKWCDVDLIQRSILVRKTKSGKQRTVRMSEKLTTVIRSLKYNSLKEFVFVNRDGLQYQDVRSAHRHALLRSGIALKRASEGKPPLKFHDLRHTFATHLAAITGNLNMVREALGHAELSTTQRYAHLTQDYYNSAIERYSNRMHSCSEDLRHNNVIVTVFAEIAGKHESQKSVLLEEDLVKTGL